MTTTDPNRTTVDVLMKLLRGETSAIEVYEQALKTLGSHPRLSEDLWRIHDDHVIAAERIRDHVRRAYGAPINRLSEGEHEAHWPTSPSNIRGPVSLLSLLQKGEEQEIDDYERALHTDALPPDCRAGIASLLHTCKRHRAYLEDMGVSIH